MSHNCKLRHRKKSFQKKIAIFEVIPQKFKIQKKIKN